MIPAHADPATGALALREARERSWDRRFQLPTLIAALLVIPAIVIDETGLTGSWEVIASVLNWSIWSVFALQVTCMLRVTPHRRHWLRTHILEILIVVLTPPILPPTLQAARVLRLLRLLRFVITARSLRSFFSVNGLKLASLLAIFGVLGAGTLYSVVESGQHLSTWDGIWWAVNTVTTSGSPYAPQTNAGRVVTIAVLVIGVGYIAILTGAMAQFFIKIMGAEVDASSEAAHRLDSLTAEVAALREEIRRLQR